MEEFKEYISKLFPLKEEQWEDFKKILSIQKLGIGDYFIKPGSVTGNIGFIRKGVLRHYIITGSGTEITTDFCVEGEFSGLPNPFKSNMNNPYSIEALTDVELLVFSPDKLENYFINHPELKGVIGDIMVGLMDLKCHRERELLGCDTRGRYLRFLKRFPGLNKLIPQHYIASYIGVTPETLSRIKAKLI